MSRILVADDEEAFRSFVCQALKRFGHTAVEASDGLEALERYEAEEIDLSLIDINMPNMNGIKFLHAVKQLDSQAVVIIMTGYPSAETILETIEDDGFTYISKPIQLDQLEDLVNQGLLNRKKRLDQLEKGK